MTQNLQTLQHVFSKSVSSAPKTFYLGREQKAMGYFLDLIRHLERSMVNNDSFSRIPGVELSRSGKHRTLYEFLEIMYISLLL